MSKRDDLMDAIVAHCTEAPGRVAVLAHSLPDSIIISELQRRAPVTIKLAGRSVVFESGSILLLRSGSDIVPRAGVTSLQLSSWFEWPPDILDRFQKQLLDTRVRLK